MCCVCVGYAYESTCSVAAILCAILHFNGIRAGTNYILMTLSPDNSINK